MAKEDQIISDGTCLIKAPVQVMEKELAEQGAPVLQALDYFLLAEKSSTSGQYAEAGDAYKKSLAILPTMAAYLNWGNICFISGRTDEAHQSYSSGLALAVKKKNRWFEGAFSCNTGHLYYSEGNPDEVLKYFNQALPALKETGKNEGIGVLLGILLKMEAVYNQMKAWDPAIECLRQALALLRKSGRKNEIARCLNNLGLTLVARQDHDQAVNIFREALDIFRELGSRKDEAEQLGNIGSVFRDTGKNELALRHYNESLAIFKELGDELGVANELGNVGYIYTVISDSYSALNYFLQAEKLYLKLGVTSRAEMTRKNINILLGKMK